MRQCTVSGVESKLVRELKGLQKALVVGIDVHKRSYAVAFVCASSKAVAADITMPADVKALGRLLGRLRDQLHLCVYEAGPTGFSLARALQSRGLPVGVVSPGSIPRASGQDNKTDRIDARRLAEYAAGGLLRCIAVPTEREDEQRQLLRHRGKARRDLTKAKNRIKMFLLYNGIHEPKGLAQWSVSALAELERMALSGLLRTELDMLLSALRFAKSHLASYEALVRRLAKREDHVEDCRRLREIPGVGLLTAMTVQVELFCPQRFHRPKQVARYAGLCPRLKQSGQTSSTTELTTNGNRHLRHVLIQSAWRWVQQDASARSRYEHLRRRTGCAQKAIVGVARKLIMIMWRMLVDRTRYKPSVAGATTGPAAPARPTPVAT